ncbi:hypothetical protein FNF31_02421 [Cafeteria roenbergensis]|uniref:EGF-like domain-containing protein n=1 Tax=Cafeteria roenbergensis TaxID=33653 RepID=A0A5A8DFS5_CAFRO|nr:hypothetical protein FNF31_02421 [Cafeteria roenbergensis]
MDAVSKLSTGEGGAPVDKLDEALALLVSLQTAVAGQMPELQVDPPSRSRSEAQLTCYPGGGSRYVRHLDAFSTTPGDDAAAGRDARRVTAILYLNADWEPAHGGRLRLFPPAVRYVVPASPLHASAPPLPGRIFVSVPAYREPDLVPTLQSLFEAARDPSRLRVGLVVQADEGADGDALSRPASALLTPAARAWAVSALRVIRCSSADAAGPVWARHLCWSLWRHEPYVLGIDSHTRFVDGFDDILIGQLAAAERQLEREAGATGGALGGQPPKAVLTTYPAAYRWPGERPSPSGEVWVSESALHLPTHDLTDSLGIFVDLVQRAGEVVPEVTRDAGQSWDWRPSSDLAGLVRPDGLPSQMPPPSLSVGAHEALAATLVLWRPFDGTAAWNESEPLSSPQPAPPFAPGEELVLLWKGSGELWLTGAVGVAKANSTAPAAQLPDKGQPAGANATASGFHRFAARVLAAPGSGGLDEGLRLHILRSLAEDPVRDVHVVPARLEDVFWKSHPQRAFHPRALGLIAASGAQVLHLADWSGTAVSWPGLRAREVSNFSSDRARPADATQGRAAMGVAVEESLRLCREVRAACWLSAPERATDAFLEAYAALLVASALADEGWAQALAQRSGGDSTPAVLYLEYGRQLGYTAGQQAGLPRLVAAMESACQLAEQRLNKPAGAVRARLRLVLTVTRAEYLPHLYELHAASGVLRSIDTVAFSGSLGQHSAITSEASWLGTEASNRAAARPAAPLTDAAVLERLRAAVLDEDVTWNRAVQRVHAWNISRTGPPLVQPAAMGAPAGQLAHEVVAFDAAVRVSLPQFGFRDRVVSLLREARTNPRLLDGIAALLPDAQAEQQAEDALIRAQRSDADSSSGTLEALMLDKYHRMERAGFAAVVAGPLMRHSQRAYGDLLPGLNLREAGSTGLTEPLAQPPAAGELGPDAAAVSQAVSSSPKLRALAGYAKGRRGALPFVLAEARPANQSDGGLACSATTCPAGCEWGTCWEGSCRCFEGASGPRCEVLGRRPCHRSPSLGINVAGIADWSTQLLFVDHARAARGFVSQWVAGGDGAWENAWPLNLTSAGELAALAPLQAAGTMLLRDLGGHYEPGTYVVLYDGDGVVVPQMDDVQTVRRTAPGRLEVDLKPTTGLNNGLFIRIERTNPLDPVRNLRVTRLEHEASFESFPFHARALARLGGLFSSIRAMDLLSTNSNVQRRWSERVTRANRTFSQQGVPLEDVVLLANMQAMDLWLNVPIAANDDYVRAMARLVKSALRPDLNVSVELANEVWSGANLAGQHARAEGSRLGMDGASTLSSGPEEAGFCWYGMRSSQVFSLWLEEWGEQERHRVQLVLGSQSANPDVSRRILACNSSWRHADALAIAPYFSASTVVDGADGLVELGVLMNTTLPASIALQHGLAREHASLAGQYGLKLVAYEAGQALAGGDEREVALKLAANRHASMERLYETYLTGLRAAGVEHAMLFSSIDRPSKHGSWGHWEALDAPDGPKVAGVAKFASALGACSRGMPSPRCPVGLPPAAVATVIVREHPDGDEEEVATLLLPSVARGNASGALAECSASGQCVLPRLGALAPECSCDHGWAGPNCSEREPVVFSSCSYDCAGHGKCLLHRIEQGFQYFYRCFCDDGYGGPRCTARACADKCNFNGKCADDLTCACFDGFKGSRCETDCGCNGHGTCSSPSRPSLVRPPSSALSETCTCDMGYEFVEGLGCQPQCQCPQPAVQRCLRPGVCSLPPGQCQNGQEVGGVCECWAGFRGRRCHLRSRPGVEWRLSHLGQFNPVGINIAGNTDWSTQWLFADLMKTARGWVSQHHPDFAPSGVYTWDTKAKQHLRADGYPASLPRGQALTTLMARDVRRQLPSGVYTVTYAGSGELFFGMDAEVVRERKGWIEVKVSLSAVRDNGIFMQIRDTDPADPLRDIRVAMPGMADRVADGALFHPAMLGFLRQFGSARFMDLQRTNEASSALRTAMPSTGVGRRRFFDIFTDVFGAAERSRRVVFVVDTQSANEWVTERIFDGAPGLASKADALGVTAYIDCGGLGSRAKAQATARMTVAEVLQACRDALPQIDAQWTRQVDALRRIIPKRFWRARNLTSVGEARALLSDSPLPLVTYEAGPALVEAAAIEQGTETPGLTELLVAATRHPAMQEVYAAYLQAFSRLGLAGGRHSSMPYMHFSSVAAPSKYGSWGLIESSAFPITSTAKGRAISEFAHDIVRGLLATGCTDAHALNFDPAARFSNGSCVYAPVQVSAAAGGSVTVASDGAAIELQFPPSALATDTPVSVKPEALRLSSATFSASQPSVGGQAEPRLFVGPLIRFGPSGTQFGKPVSVCITLNMSLVNEFGWDAWTPVDAQGDAESWQSANASRPAAVPPTDAAGELDPQIEAEGGAGVGLYHSQNGSVWHAADASEFDPATGQLCAKLHHFTLVSGVRANATLLRLDSLREGAGPTPAPSPSPASAGDANPQQATRSEGIPWWVWAATGGAIALSVVAVAAVATWWTKRASRRRVGQPDSRYNPAQWHGGPPEGPRMVPAATAGFVLPPRQLAPWPTPPREEPSMAKAAIPHLS